MTLVSVSPKDQDDSGLWCYPITVNSPLRDIPTHGGEYKVYNIQCTVSNILSPGGRYPPGRLYVYNIQCRVYFPLGTLPSRGVRSIQYTVYSPGGEYAVYSTLPHWGLYLSWTSAVNTAAAARFLYSVNFSISVGPPRIRMGPDCGAIARFCFVVVHLRLVYTLCSVSPSV